MKKLMIDISNIKTLSRISLLKEREETLMHALKDVRKEIRYVAEASQGRKPASGGALTHIAALKLVLSREGKPMKLKELAAKAVEVGAVSNSKTATNSFCRAMIQRSDIFKNVGWGMWTLR